MPPIEIPKHEYNENDTDWQIYFSVSSVLSVAKNEIH